jgi:DNA-binding CsgD family transcriptional regulator
LVIRGEAGIGKSALLEYCAQQASDCRVAQIAGVEAELEMPFAALHQLCLPMLDNLAFLPEPQKRALQVALGISVGNASDRFVVGLAVLSLLADVATERPLVCLVDDAQWLDESSLQVLGFVGRRLLAESVLLVFGAREEEDDRCLPSLPELNLRGLADDDARSLLRDAIAGKLDEQVRDRIVAETHGNPLGLVELPRAMSPAELAGGFANASPASVSGQLNDHYMRRVRALPESTQRLMLLAAADPTGDSTVFWRAAQVFDVGRDAAAIAEMEQLLEIGSRVRFRHPLVRSASYAAATAEDRRAAHLALADAADEASDPERRVWHRAAAATGRDEAVAVELEATAGTARARAGLAAAAAFLQRAVELTAEPTKLASRALAAAEASIQAGAFDSARSLLAQAGGAAIDDLQRARVEQFKGQIEWASNPGRTAPVLLLRAARRLEALDVQRARDTYLEAWIASLVAGRLADPGGDLLEVSRAARSVAPPVREPGPSDLFLDGFATLVTDGRAAAAPNLRRAVDAFLGDRVSPDDWVRWGHLATSAATFLWDFDNWVLLTDRHLELNRASGALAPLSIALRSGGATATWRGDFETAAAFVAEEGTVAEVTGLRMASIGALMLAAYRGRPTDASPLIAATAADSIASGEGMGSQLASWMTAVLHNGLGHYADALAAAEPAADEVYSPALGTWALPELVEAAVRSGKPELARDAVRRLSAMTIADNDWASGLEARSLALVSEREDAEAHYADAVERLGRTQIRTELARAHLLYGEWLRRENRRVDARGELRTAYDMFATMGAEAFAERARRELVATGETARKREVDMRNDLTPQEAHVARLARDGQTNAEIAAELFLSARTVEWHLRKVFNKLGIASRRDLKNALPPPPGSPA